MLAAQRKQAARAGQAAVSCSVALAVLTRPVVVCSGAITDGTLGQQGNGRTGLDAQCQWLQAAVIHHHLAPVHSSPYKKWPCDPAQVDFLASKAMSAEELAAQRERLQALTKATRVVELDLDGERVSVRPPCLQYSSRLVAGAGRRARVGVRPIPGPLCLIGTTTVDLELDLDGARVSVRATCPPVCLQ